MSDTFLSIIPTDPHWQPNPDGAALTTAFMKKLCPNAAGEPEVHRHDTPAFVHAGANLETISCPRCGKQLDLQGWWMPRMDQAYNGNGFSDLRVCTPCCGTDTTLNDLKYDGACGFASFEVKILNPNKSELIDEELALIGQELGHSVRQVWAHI
ncbi:hypothetical protein [Streptomyces sp. NPDC059991]|uniref:hypothetical protein n=1 Tax=unclassified Streptomyces TaxID=2593676 RepID=UPI0036CFDF50